MKIVELLSSTLYEAEPSTPADLTGAQNRQNSLIGGDFRPPNYWGSEQEARDKALVQADMKAHPGANDWWSMGFPNPYAFAKYYGTQVDPHEEESYKNLAGWGAGNSGDAAIALGRRYMSNPGVLRNPSDVPDPENFVYSGGRDLNAVLRDGMKAFRADNPAEAQRMIDAEPNMALADKYALRDRLITYGTGIEQHSNPDVLPGHQPNAWYDSLVKQAGATQPSQSQAPQSRQQPTTPQASPQLGQPQTTPQQFAGMRPGGTAQGYQLQQQLNARGANLATDGIIGPQTKAATRTFQSQNGLNVDGIAGPRTQAAFQQNQPVPNQPPNTPPMQQPGARPVQPPTQAAAQAVRPSTPPPTPLPQVPHYAMNTPGAPQSSPAPAPTSAPLAPGSSNMAMGGAATPKPASPSPQPTTEAKFKTIPKMTWGEHCALFEAEYKTRLNGR